METDSFLNCAAQICTTFLNNTTRRALQSWYVKMANGNKRNELHLRCFIFCKDDVTRLEGALKKLLTSPVIMLIFI